MARCVVDTHVGNNNERLATRAWEREDRGVGREGRPQKSAAAMGGWKSSITIFARPWRSFNCRKQHTCFCVSLCERGRRHTRAEMEKHFLFCTPKELPFIEIIPEPNHPHKNKTKALFPRSLRCPRDVAGPLFTL